MPAPFRRRVVGVIRVSVSGRIAPRRIGGPCRVSTNPTGSGQKPPTGCRDPPKDSVLEAGELEGSRPGVAGEQMHELKLGIEHQAAAEVADDQEDRTERIRRVASDPPASPTTIDSAP